MSSRSPTTRHDAWELYGNPRPGAVLFTCEHASNRVPAPYRPRPSDRKLLPMHWGYDLGARDVMIELVRQSKGVGLATRFSRLLIDPNRDPHEPTAVLRSCDDGSPTFNRVIDLTTRVIRFHRPFHDAIDGCIRAARPRFLISIHSFTPTFRGQKRAMEAGVLFDQHDDIALRLVQTMNDVGLRTVPNEPYSGKAGLIYSAARHGGNHDLTYLELELRQDLIATTAKARRIARRLWTALVAAGV